MATFIVAVILYTPGCADTEQSEGDFVKAGDVIGVYEEIMNRTAIHPDVPESVDDSNRVPVHFYHTYKEMSERFAQVHDSEGLAGDEKRRISRLVTLSGEIAEQWGAIAGASNDEMVVRERERLRQLLEELVATLQEIK
ncbi:MAG: hypothetical protein WD294_02395 [Phycisphaeraceae bacterium]